MGSNAVRWSELVDDVLHLILQRLNVKDRIKCGAVCSSWRCVVSDTCIRPPPFLMLEYDRPRSQTYRQFYILLDGVFCKLPTTTRFRRKYEARRPTRCYGYLHGWLFIDATDGRLQRYYLQNPMKRKGIELPSTLSWSVTSVVLSSAPTFPNCIVVVELGTREILKGGFSRFAWYRLGDQRWIWNEFVTAEMSPSVSMAFHKGRLYVVDQQQSVHVYSFNPQPRLVGAFALHATAAKIYDLNLVDCGDELLSVVKHHWPCRFSVFKLDDRDNTWVKIDSLGDRVLLLNKDGSLAFFSSKENNFIGSENFHGNCIYHYAYSSGIVSVYSLEDGSGRALFSQSTEGVHPRIDWIMS